MEYLGIYYDHLGTSKSVKGNYSKNDFGEIDIHLEK